MKCSQEVPNDLPLSSHDCVTPLGVMWKDLDHTTRPMQNDYLELQDTLRIHMNKPQFMSQVDEWLQR